MYRRRFIALNNIVVDIVLAADIELAYMTMQPSPLLKRVENKELLAKYIQFSNALPKIHGFICCLFT